MSCRVPDFFGASFFVIAFGVSVMVGLWCGGAMSRLAVDGIDRRQMIEDACIGGNANACALFESKFGRR